MFTDLQKKYLQFKHSVKLLNRIETLEKVVNDRMSMARFGDGECQIMFNNQNVYFQKYSVELAERLRQAVASNNPKFLTCFNNQFLLEKNYRVVVELERGQKEYSQYLSVHKNHDVGILQRSKQQKMYRKFLKKFAPLTKNKTIGDSTLFFLGYYFDEYRSKNLDHVLQLYKKLFSDQRALFIAPTTPVMQPSFKELVNQKIISSIRSAEFIDCPDNNAFENYNEIKKMVVDKLNDIDTVYISAGPLAKVLAHEITTDYGKIVLDVGSLNVSLFKANKTFKTSF